MAVSVIGECTHTSCKNFRKNSKINQLTTYFTQKLIISYSVPHTTILGNSDLFIEAGSTINLTCIIQAESMRDTHIYWNYEGKVSFNEMQEKYKNI